VIRTYSTAEVTQIVGAPSERWLIEQLRAGHFPSREVGRGNWRTTEQDIADALDLCRNELRVAHSNVFPVVGLTPRSKQRLLNLARLGGGGDDAA
jgi:hypothetical protein